MAVGTFTDLSVTENFADDTKLTEAQLSTANTSIETFCNTTLTRNLEQLAKDCFGNANYTFDSDGDANLTNNLFDKQYVTDYYNGGAIDIETTADSAWEDVDATNASVTITPEIVGKYRAVFTFNHRATSTATTECSMECGFRITDGTTGSYAVNSGAYLPATAANSGVLINPVSITFVFDWSTTTAKTIKLQKFLRTATNISANVVDAAAANGEIYMVVEKI